jgi:hypothetical protein
MCPVPRLVCPVVTKGIRPYALCQVGHSAPLHFLCFPCSRRRWSILYHVLHQQPASSSPRPCGLFLRARPASPPCEVAHHRPARCRDCAWLQTPYFLRFVLLMRGHVTTGCHEGTSRAGMTRWQNQGVANRRRDCVPVGAPCPSRRKGVANTGEAKKKQ